MMSLGTVNAALSVLMCSKTDIQVKNKKALIFLIISFFFRYIKGQGLLY